MQLSALETIRLGEFPNLLFVRLHTDEGLVGLGETFFGAQAVAAYLHESAAPVLLGKDPLQIDRHRRDLAGYVGRRGSGVETRGNSALDIALWDLFGKTTGLPLYQLLGGASRERVRTYNTCAGYRYVRARPAQVVANWGLPQGGQGEGPYEDLDAFLHRADELAHSLLEQGITGIKIWPFDPYAEASGGLFISDDDLQRGLEPFRKIRRAVGKRMDLMVELHALWNLPAAVRIAQALEEIEPFWIEDPVRPESIEALAAFKRANRSWTTASELLASRFAFRELLEQRATDVVMLDLSWCGGVSEAKAIAGMAEAYHLPIAPHDCTGPVTYVASVHLSINAPNALIQESVRAFYTGWYRELVTALPRVADGYIYPLTGSGLGTELLPDLTRRPDATVQVTRLSDLGG